MMILAAIAIFVVGCLFGGICVYWWAMGRIEFWESKCALERMLRVKNADNHAQFLLDQLDILNGK